MTEKHNLIVFDLDLLKSKGDLEQFRKLNNQFFYASHIRTDKQLS